MENGRIDIHHHYNPQFFLDILSGKGGDPSGWKLPDWSKAADKTFMQQHNIRTSILSVTAPGAADLVGDEAVKVARQLNEYAAQMRDDDPASYGFFANLPSIKDKESTLAELSYAMDVLKADGVTIFTRYGSGDQYLGHPDFQYLWAELNRRSAVVFVHPTHAVNTVLWNPLVPQPVLDYALETTKAAIDVILSKTIRNFPNLKIILSHAGGALPFLIERTASILPCEDASYVTSDIIEDAQQFYFDTALSGSDAALTVLQKFAKPGHILYGSDFPYAPNPSIDYHTKALDAFPFRHEEFLQEINRKNGLALFPRLVKHSE